jgi:serine protease Do
MHKYFLAAIILLPVLAAGATAAQTPSFDPRSGSYAFSSDESSGGSSYLGVDTRDITHDRVSELKLKDETGVEVTMVDQDAPAGKAGIKEHDVILTINGNKVESVEQLRRMIHEIPPGRVVNIGLSRNGQPVNLQVQLGERHSRAFSVKIPPMPPMPLMPDFDVPMSVVVVHSAMRSGLMVENLTPQLGEFFGAKNGQGVLVRSVEKGSHADKAGFRAGDVIVRVDKDPVHDSGDFSHALRSHRGGEPVRIGIIRDKKEQTITLTLPERRQSGDLFEEESFDFPDINIEADLHLDQLQTELANLQPQIDLAMKEASRGLDEIGKQMCDQQKRLHDQQKQMKKQMRKESLKFQKEWKSQERELRRELQVLQRSATEI